jgi:lysophospholipase L1-like esterase
MNLISALFARGSKSLMKSNDMSKSSSTDSSLRFLALGDSLTRGYMKFGSEHYPYTERLARILKENHISAHIDNHGYNGFITSQLEPILLEALGNHAYDVVMILAGTNDLPLGYRDGEYTHPPTRITGNLQAMYESVLNSSADVKLIAMTIPPIFHYKGYELTRLDSRRDAVNDWIRSYVAEHPDRVYLLDVHDFMDPTIKALWDDNLHFTRKGYDKMGEEMARLLLSMNFNAKG